MECEASFLIGKLCHWIVSFLLFYQDQKICQFCLLFCLFMFYWDVLLVYLCVLVSFDSDATFKTKVMPLDHQVIFYLLGISTALFHWKRRRSSISSSASDSTQISRLGK